MKENSQAELPPELDYWRLKELSMEARWVFKTKYFPPRNLFLQIFFYFLFLKYFRIYVEFLYVFNFNVFQWTSVCATSYKLGCRFEVSLRCI
jgi:hypothetical protein